MKNPGFGPAMPGFFFAKRSTKMLIKYQATT